jgi:hypothetical protein
VFAQDGIHDVAGSADPKSWENKKTIRWNLLTPCCTLMSPAACCACCQVQRESQGPQPRPESKVSCCCTSQWYKMSERPNPGLLNMQMFMCHQSRAASRLGSQSKGPKPRSDSKVSRFCTTLQTSVCKCSFGCTRWLLPVELYIWTWQRENQRPSPGRSSRCAFSCFCRATCSNVRTARLFDLSTLASTN